MVCPHTTSSYLQSMRACYDVIKSSTYFFGGGCLHIGLYPASIQYISARNISRIAAFSHDDSRSSWGNHRRFSSKEQHIIHYISKEDNELWRSVKIFEDKQSEYSDTSYCTQGLEWKRSSYSLLDAAMERRWQLPVWFSRLVLVVSPYPVRSSDST